LRRYNQNEVSRADFRWACRQDNYETAGIVRRQRAPGVWLPDQFLSGGRCETAQQRIRSLGACSFVSPERSDLAEHPQGPGVQTAVLHSHHMVVSGLAMLRLNDSATSDSEAVRVATRA